MTHGTKGAGGQPLLPSLLDRLAGGGASGRPRALGLREIKEGIRRDIEDLLNTRWRPTAWPAALDELDASLVNYGIPDFTGTNLGSPTSQEEFSRVIVEAIRRFEPRLRDVTVKLVKSGDSLDRILRFRIEAVLRVEPAPEPIAFDSSLEPMTATFEVKEGSR